MNDLQILDTYGYTMCPARSEIPQRSIDGNITMQLVYKPQNVLNRAYGEIAKVP